MEVDQTENDKVRYDDVVKDEYFDMYKIIHIEKKSETKEVILKQKFSVGSLT